MSANLDEGDAIDVAKVLLEIDAAKPENITQTEISNELNMSRSTVRRRIQKAKELGLIEVNDSTRTNIKTLTRQGQEFLHKVDPYSQEKTGQSFTDFGMVDLHYVIFEHKIENTHLLPNDWMETAYEKRLGSSTYNESNKTLQIDKDCFKIRVTSERVFFRFTESLKGYDVEKMKSEIFDQANEARKWLEEKTQLNFDDRYKLKYKVTAQHLAILNDPLVDMIRQSNKMRLEEVKPFEDDGEVILWIDSSGDSGGHLEAGGPNGVGGKGLVNIGEDAVCQIQEFYMSIVRNWDGWENLIRTVKTGKIEKLLDLEPRVADLERKAELLEKRRSSNKEALCDNCLGQTDDNTNYNGEASEFNPADRCGDNGIGGCE